MPVFSLKEASVQNIANPKRNWMLVFFLGIGLLFCSRLVGASLEKPEVMLQHVTQQMLDALRENESLLKTNPEKIVDLVDDILVPHFESQDMAKWVVGRNAWLQASSDQRKQFTDEFKVLLIRTYATTLTAYTNQTVIYLPVRGDYTTKKRIQVSSIIRDPGKESIKIAYRLVQRDNQWKVYDIIIEGVSLLKGFQSQFSPDIQQYGL